MKTKHNIDRKYGIAYCRILKKKSFLKNEKVANRKLGNLENLGNIIPSFLISKFSILPYSQNRKLAFKNLGKKIPSFPRFPSFPSFRPGLFTNMFSFEKSSKNLHRNLKLIFLFSTIFFHFKIGYRQSFIIVLRISFFFDLWT